MCLRGHSIFCAPPRPPHFNVGHECAQGGDSVRLEQNLKNLSTNSPQTHRALFTCAANFCLAPVPPGLLVAYPWNCAASHGAPSRSTELLTKIHGKNTDSFGTNIIWLKLEKRFFVKWQGFDVKIYQNGQRTVKTSELEDY